MRLLRFTLLSKVALMVNVAEASSLTWLPNTLTARSVRLLLTVSVTGLGPLMRVADVAGSVSSVV